VKLFWPPKLIFGLGNSCKSTCSRNLVTPMGHENLNADLNLGSFSSTFSRVSEARAKAVWETPSLYRAPDKLGNEKRQICSYSC
jgi:hypothetical protein